MNCIQVFHDHRPFEIYSDKGLAASIAKRALIGLIATAAIAVGFYFAGMAIYKIWNPLSMPLNAQMILCIVNSSLIGLIGLVTTAVVLYKTKKDYDPGT